MLQYPPIRLPGLCKNHPLLRYRVCPQSLQLRFRRHPHPQFPPDQRRFRLAQQSPTVLRARVLRQQICLPRLEGQLLAPGLLVTRQVLVCKSLDNPQKVNLLLQVQDQVPQMAQL